jgi:hypothetical protein
MAKPIASALRGKQQGARLTIQFLYRVVSRHRNPDAWQASCQHYALIQSISRGCRISQSGAKTIS